MAFSVESYSYSLDVFHLATFCCEVSVALQCDVLALNFDNAMQYIVARTDFCQYRLTDIVYLAFGKQGFVALVFQEWTHGKAPELQGDSVSLIKQLNDFGQ